MIFGDRVIFKERTYRLGGDGLSFVVAGRTYLGVAYAHVVRGSEVLRTYRGPTRGGCLARARASTYLDERALRRDLLHEVGVVMMWLLAVWMLVIFVLMAVLLP